MNKLILPALAALLLCTAAQAAPVLKSQVSINHPVITVGDMFDDAGLLAERALFRAPEPGTTGIVSLDAVRAAATRAGLTDYVAEGVLSVRVERQVTLIGADTLQKLIRDDLARRGLVAADVEVDTRFDTPDISFRAENVPSPISLTSLDYQAGAAMFSARFEIAGIALPVDVSGRIDLMVEVPHLISSLKAGDTITAADLDMQKVPVGYADQSGVIGFDELIGKQMRRASRAGVMLKASDVTEPLAVKRNTQVTVRLYSGPLTLTMIGQSLGDATAGQTVQVMNSVSRKILTGVAAADGTVQVVTASAQLKLAGL
ncbi:MAG: flagellar basal body P-ring formation chaperone FlgA [Rubrivivax sp.]